MNMNNLEQYLFPIILILFFSYRFYKFKKIRKMLPKLLSEGALLIDVRSENEFASSHNPSSINIPLDQINSYSEKLNKNVTIVLCCASGTRSGLAVGILKKNGLKNVFNIGSWKNSLLRPKI